MEKARNIAKTMIEQEAGAFERAAEVIASGAYTKPEVIAEVVSVLKPELAYESRFKE